MVGVRFKNGFEVYSYIQATFVSTITLKSQYLKLLKLFLTDRPTDRQTDRPTDRPRKVDIEAPPRSLKIQL